MQWQLKKLGARTEESFLKKHIEKSKLVNSTREDNAQKATFELLGLKCIKYHALKYYVSSQQHP